jgi:hypothetical protein
MQKQEDGFQEEKTINCPIWLIKRLFGFIVLHWENLNRENPFLTTSE